MVVRAVGVPLTLTTLAAEQLAKEILAAKEDIRAQAILAAAAAAAQVLLAAIARGQLAAQAVRAPPTQLLDRPSLMAAAAAAAATQLGVLAVLAVVDKVPHPARLAPRTLAAAAAVIQPLRIQVKRAVPVS